MNVQDQINDLNARIAAIKAESRLPIERGDIVISNTGEALVAYHPEYHTPNYRLPTEAENEILLSIPEFREKHDFFKGCAAQLKALEASK